MQETNVVIIASDGGCSPNPGRGGWAYAIFAGEPLPGKLMTGAEGQPFVASGCVDHSTNNIMELTGLISALRALRDEFSAGRLAPCRVKLHLDSRYTLDSFFDWLPGWKKRGWKKADGKPVKNLEQIQALDQLKVEMQAMGVSFEKSWVRGHSGDFANELVDSMLNDARDKGIAAASECGEDQGSMVSPR